MDAALPRIFNPPIGASDRSWWSWMSVLWLPVAVVALACAAAASPALSAAWELERAAVARGELWRVFTGHLTHWNLDHLFWDAATFAALAAACMHWSPRRTMACLIGAMIAISATVLAAHGELATYRGLSGLDTALFTLLAMLMWRDARRNGDRALGAVAKWALAGLLAKTAYELASGDTLFVDSAAAGFVPLASAHAAGAVVGLLATTRA